MALIEKETLLKGLWDVVLIVLSGTVCVVGASYAVNRALSHMPGPAGGPGHVAPGVPGLPPVPGTVPVPGDHTGADPHLQTPESATKEPEPAEPKKEKKKKKKGEEGEKSAGGLTYPLKTTVLNLATDSNHRFAKVSITLEADSEEAVTELKEVEHQIYDCLVETLGNVRAQDIGSDAGKDLLKETLRSKMNKFLKEGKIINVYLTEFLVQ
jgi:flagellar basal body-associated protein FliL